MNSQRHFTLRNYSIVLAAATILSILYTGDNLLTGGPGGILALKRFVVVLVGWYSWVALLPLMQRIAERHRFRRKGWLKLFAFHLAIAVFFACMLFGVQVWLAKSLGLSGKRDDLQIVSWKIVNYFQILVLLYALQFYRSKKEQEKKACRLQARIDELQLQTLKTRLRPAFLFETLDRLAEVMKKDPDLADDLIAMIGDFLRNTLLAKESERLKLREELDIVHNYLKIESSLLPNTLRFRSEIDSELTEAYLPGLLLQPLLESAIHNKHGASTIDLLIRIVKNEDHLRMTIDEGESPGTEQVFETEWITRTREHLTETYGNDYVFDVALAPGRGFRTQVEIPLRFPDEEDADFEIDQMAESAAKSLMEEDLESYTSLLGKQMPPRVQSTGPLKRIALQYAISLGIWTILILYFVVRIDLSAAVMHDMVSRVDLGFVIYAWYVWAALTPAVLWISRRLPIQPPHALARVAAHFGISIAFWLLISVIDILPMPFFYKGTYASFLRETLQSYGFAIDLLVYWTIVCVDYAIEYHKAQQDEAMRSSALELQFVRAQLQALHMQLHPHFLFNTLHLISELVHEDIDQAAKMLDRLKEFLSLTIENSSSHEIALDQELQFLKHYLEIQQIRFQNRLRVRLNVEDSALPLLVPNLILQPLVENAIRHGISRKPEAGLLEIDIQRSNGTLRMQVKDDGPGMNGKLKEGLGLSNTRARLQRLYGSSHQFELQNPIEGGLIVTVKIPAMEKQ